MSDYEDFDVEDFENEEDYKSDNENEEKEQYIEFNNNRIKEEEEDDNDLDFINEDIVINSENIKTTKFLTLYEKTAVIGIRSKELFNQYNKCEFMPLVDINNDMINEFGELDFIKIAEKEVNMRRIPYYICRKLQNNRYTIVDINGLLLKDIY